MSNSALICYTKLSPNHSGNRTHAIDTISIHCMAGNLSVESCGALFAKSSRQASSNYGIGSDGRIALYVPEAYRSWCTSSRANDQRAITIEVANNGGAPDWPVSDKAYQALLNLVEDICQRNSIKKLVWSTVKNNRVNHVGGCNMTVHRDYAAKACPGDYLYDRHGSIAAEINKRLDGGSSTPSTPTTGSEQTATNYTVKVTATDLNIRSGPGTNYGRKGFIPPASIPSSRRRTAPARPNGASSNPASAGFPLITSPRPAPGPRRPRPSRLAARSPSTTEPSTAASPPPEGRRFPLVCPARTASTPSSSSPPTKARRRPSCRKSFLGSPSSTLTRSNPQHRESPRPAGRGLFFRFRASFS